MKRFFSITAEYSTNKSVGKINIGYVSDSLVKNAISEYIETVHNVVLESIIL